MPSGRIVYTQAFRDFCSKKLGVRPSHVEAALRTAERADDISHMGGNFRLHSARVTRSTPETLLLILEQLEGDERKIMDAVPVPADTHQDLFALSPLEVLSLVAERCGREFKFAGRPTKFVRQDSCPITGEGKVVEISDDGSDFSAMGLMQVQPGTPPTAHLSMFWVLDLKKYRAWRHPPR